MKNNLYFKVMTLVAVIVLVTFFFVNFYILNSFRDRLIRQVPKSAVDTAFAIVQGYGKKVESGTMTLADAQAHTKEDIASLRLDDGSYFWIHSLELKMIMHPIKKELNNQDLHNYKTPNGEVLFADMNAVVTSNQGQGWHSYYWTKPNETSLKEKTSYIRLYKDWGWVVGSGMYVEDVEKEMRPFFIKIQIILAGLFVASLVLGHLLSNRISLKLLKVSGDVEHTADSLNSIANDTKTSVNTLAQISVEQSAAIEETAASLQEISMMAEQNSKNAAEALNFSEKNKLITLEGQTALSSLQASISNIEKSINSMSDEMEQNNSRFQDIFQVINEIENKTKVINDIVFQTKLLSFNASVEAARAGENGKGFAVVAEEIGKLAHVSGEAAKDINQLITNSSSKINAMLNDSKKVITSINAEALATMNKGHTTGQDFVHIFDKMIVTIEQINSSIHEMSLASKEQGMGIVEINSALSELTQTGHLTMDATATIKSKIEELTTDADNLNQDVSVLKKEVNG